MASAADARDAGSLIDYEERVAHSFARLKGIGSESELGDSCLFLDQDAGKLVPICRLHEHDCGIIELLGTWRRRNMHVYPTQFTVTSEGTARWLRERLLDAPGRISFLVIEPGGRPVGHVGLDNALGHGRTMRLDNVMRGEDDVAPGTMSLAVGALLKWARVTLAAQLVWVDVFSDNDAAIRFFRRCGFRDERLIPLEARTDGHRLLYEHTDGPATRYHLRMTLAA